MLVGSRVLTNRWYSALLTCSLAAGRSPEWAVAHAVLGAANAILCTASRCRTWRTGRALRADRACTPALSPTAVGHTRSDGVPARARVDLLRFRATGTGPFWRFVLSAHADAPASLLLVPLNRPASRGWGGAPPASFGTLGVALVLVCPGRRATAREWTLRVGLDPTGLTCHRFPHQTGRFRRCVARTLPRVPPSAAEPSGAGWLAQDQMRHSLAPWHQKAGSNLQPRIVAVRRHKPTLGLAGATS